MAPVIDIDEYSRKYIRVLENSGYKSFMLFDESGNYLVKKRRRLMTEPPV